MSSWSSKKPSWHSLFLKFRTLQKIQCPSPRRKVWMLLAFATVVGGCGGSDPTPGYALPVASESSSPEGRAPRVELLSSRRDTVSGGDAVIAVSNDPASESAPATDLKVSLNGVDVSSSLEHDPSGKRLVGRIAGFHVGENTISAQSKYGPATLVTVKNHSSSGPIISGPHQVPWICETESSGLGAASDASCTVSSRLDWYYVTTSNAFKQLTGFDGRLVIARCYWTRAGAGKSPHHYAGMLAVFPKAVDDPRRDPSAILRLWFLPDSVHRMTPEGSKGGLCPLEVPNRIAPAVEQFLLDLGYDYDA